MSRLATLLAAVAFPLAVACSDGDSPRATPAVSPSATATATDEATPIATQGTATPATYPLAGRSELFVYTVGTGADQTADRLFPRRAVIVQDLATGKLLTRFVFSGLEGTQALYPVGVQLAGRRLIVATESAVTRYEIDGSSPLVLLEEPNAGAGAYFGIQDIAVSGDGKYVAIARGCGPPNCETGPAVAIVEVETARLLVEIGYPSLRASGFRGYAWQLVWRADVPGVLVIGATGSEAPGGRAVIGLDTAVEAVETPRAHGNLSPDGRFSFENEQQLQCMFIGGKSLAMVELRSGSTLFSVSERAGAYTPWEWSPDGASVVYMFRDGDTSGCDWTESEPEIFTANAATGRTATVADLRELHREWYRERFVESGCERPILDQPVLDRYLNLSIPCAGTGAGVGDLLVGGVKVAHWDVPATPAGWPEFEPVGFLPK